MQTERQLQSLSFPQEAASDKEAALFYLSTKYDRFPHLHQDAWQPYIVKYP